MFKEHPDEVVKHKLWKCATCDEKLDADHMEKIVTRQVHDLPELPKKRVTEHQTYGCKFKSCGSTTRAEFPSYIQGSHTIRPQHHVLYSLFTCRTIHLNQLDEAVAQRDFQYEDFNGYHPVNVQAQSSGEGIGLETGR